MKNDSADMMTLALVACAKSKQASAAPASELYVSPWFEKAKTYATSRSDDWRILSARHGCLHPDTIIDPYEQSLYDMNALERRKWAAGVLDDLSATLTIQVDVIILAGHRYRQYLMDPIRDIARSVQVSMEGLGIGEQLRFLNRELS